VKSQVVRYLPEIDKLIPVHPCSFVSIRVRNLGFRFFIAHCHVNCEAREFGNESIEELYLLNFARVTGLQSRAFGLAF
jgi:hypothetical protein